ncbi:MAG: hypothetical protein GXP49_01440 [Deltaproteobacteria bacterium]|nr:hypothetical protein [Deltaproteobacteria bacterium]
MNSRKICTWKILLWTAYAFASVSILSALILPPGDWDPLSYVLARAVVVLPTMTLLPGLPWALVLFKKQSGKAQRLDIMDIILLGLGFSFIGHVLALVLLKLTGFTTVSTALLVTIVLESLPPAFFLRTRNINIKLDLASTPRAAIMAFMIFLAGILGMAFLTFTDASRPVYGYWYDHAVENGIVSPSWVSFSHSPSWGRPERYGPKKAPALVFKPVRNKLPLEAMQAGSANLFFLLQAPVGAKISLFKEGRIIATGKVEARPVESPAEGPVLRYLHNGITAIRSEISVSQGEKLVLRVDSPPGFRLVDLTNAGKQAINELNSTDLREIHYYQELNIAENYLWVREILKNRWLVIHQPPFWTYLSAAFKVILGPLNYTFFLLSLVILVLTGMACIKLVYVSEPGSTLPVLLVPAVVILMQQKLMAASSCIVFPDQAYSLTFPMALLGIMYGGPLLFGTWGFLSGILRYPGTIVLSAGALFLGPNFKRTRMFLKAAWLPMAALCILATVAGLVSGHLTDWLNVLYFETFPEHFHGNYDLGTLVSRIPGFYREMLMWSGFIPILSLAMLSGTGRRLALFGIFYSFLLSTIDHVSPHYFLPIQTVLACSGACNVSVMIKKRRSRIAPAVAWIIPVFGIAWLLFSGTV